MTGAYKMAVDEPEWLGHAKCRNKNVCLCTGACCSLSGTSGRRSRQEQNIHCTVFTEGKRAAATMRYTALLRLSLLAHMMCEVQQRGGESRQPPRTGVWGFSARTARQLETGRQDPLTQLRQTRLAGLRRPGSSDIAKAVAFLPSLLAPPVQSQPR